MDNWATRVEEIEAEASPGNKLLSLSLLRDMRMAQVSLRRLAGLSD